MQRENLVLTIDAGNTSIKIGVFENGALKSVSRYESKQLSDIIELINTEQPTAIAISSVISQEFISSLKEYVKNIFEINQSVQLPIELNYETPQTLGIDRLCNAVAISNLNPNKNSVSIDIGTCVKFDFVDENSNYQGGSISPGIDLRYKALNDYTANLPLLTDKAQIQLIGKSTKGSIQSGVMNGIKAEIDQLIHNYENEFGSLTFFVTGGDAQYFDFGGKNNIFVDENLTLKGLYLIYLLNAK